MRLIEAEPVVHARWTDATPAGCVTTSGDPFVVCSHCGGSKHLGQIEDIAFWKYCPNCGARMDEK